MIYLINIPESYQQFQNLSGFESQRIVFPCIPKSLVSGIRTFKKFTGLRLKPALTPGFFTHICIQSHP